MGKHLLNYETRVGADRSIAEISKMLAKAGARKIMHDYDDQGNITALTFAIDLEGNSVGFRLPTDWRPVQKVLEQQGLPPSKTTQERALMVAWRITKDWVEAQLAILETKMVTTPQLFLPYAVTNNGSTLYEHIAANPTMLLGGGSE